MTMESNLWSLFLALKLNTRPHLIPSQRDLQHAAISIHRGHSIVQIGLHLFLSSMITGLDGIYPSKLLRNYRLSPMVTIRSCRSGEVAGKVGGGPKERRPNRVREEYDSEMCREAFFNEYELKEVPGQRYILGSMSDGCNGGVSGGQVAGDLVYLFERSNNDGAIKVTYRLNYLLYYIAYCATYVALVD